MKSAELRKKTVEELGNMEKTLKEKGRDLRFQLASGKMKNTREIRATKKEIARVATLLKEKHHAKA